MSSTIRPQSKLSLEDFSVNDEFVSREVEVTLDEIRSYAAKFDPQPFHLDEMVAEKSFFQGLAASGWHTAGLAMRLLVDTVPIESGIIGAGSEIRWHLPVRPGDRLRSVIAVKSVDKSASRPDRGLIQIEMKTSNQDGKLCQTILARLVVFCRSPKSAVS